MMHSKPAVEESGQPQTTPEACKVASAMAKIFIFALRLSRPPRLRLSRKPSPRQKKRLRLPLADATTRVFSHERCRSSKQWVRLFFVTMRCGSERSARPQNARVEALKWSHP